MAEILSLKLAPRRLAESLPARLQDVMLISFFREQPALHDFLKALFRRRIVTIGDLPKGYEALADEFDLDAVSRKIFLDRLRDAARPLVAAMDGRILKFEPRG